MTGPGFPSTLWTLIRSAGAGREAAVADFVTRYRPAVVRFACRRGLDAAEAEDIAQEVFVRVFDDGLLGRADRAQGRFRSLLLAVTRHVLGHHFERRSAQKRGGGKAPLSLDRTDVAAIAEVAARDERDPDFDREWLAALLARALERLKVENRSYHECLSAFLVHGKSHKEVAAALGKTEAQVRHAISRGKAKLGAILRDEIAEYALSPGEFADEVRYLSALLDRSEAPEKP
ncbi:RNA polymerase sigma factor [bacterium]|nr:RNA polymerase sigma factor [bacterium]